MSIIQKVLLTFENWETTVKINNGPDNEIRLYVQPNVNMLEVLEIRTENYDRETGAINIRGSKVVSEVEDLGGFSFAAGDPDYTLMQLRPTATLDLQINSVLDTDIFSVFTFPEPILETIGVILMELVWKDAFIGESEESLGVTLDATASEIRQPFHLEIASADETSAGANDGTIDVNLLTSWGGTNPLQFSFDGGGFAALASFSGLAPATYTIQARDADLMLSEIRSIIISPGV